MLKGANGSLKGVSSGVLQEMRLVLPFHGRSTNQFGTRRVLQFLQAVKTVLRQSSALSADESAYSAVILFIVASEHDKTERGVTNLRHLRSKRAICITVKFLSEDWLDLGDNAFFDLLIEYTVCALRKIDEKAKKDSVPESLSDITLEITRNLNDIRQLYNDGYTKKMIDLID